VAPPPSGRAERLYDARLPGEPRTDHVAVERQAFAWNPSGAGFKVEDTILATAAGVEILSPDPDWPCLEVAGRQRPDVLA
jgi:Xaa-Pro dipeptidase